MRLGITSRIRAQPSIAHLVAWVVLGVVTAWLLRSEGKPGLSVPTDVRVDRGLVYAGSGFRWQRLDLYRPAAMPPRGGWPCLIAIHGGGWVGGSRSDYGPSLIRLVGQGLAIVPIDYTLARPGEPSWPRNLDDARAALRWVGDHADRYQIDRERIGLIGASAGGQLALLLGNESGTRQDPTLPRVRVVVDFYGPTDLASLVGSGSPATVAVERYLGGRPPDRPLAYRLASPIQGVGPRTPPTWITHGDEDWLIPLAQSQQLADALQDVGVTHRLVMLPNTRHGFGLDAGTRDLVPDLLGFLDQVWGPTRERTSPRRP